MTASVISDWFPAGSRAEPLQGCWRLADSGGSAPLGRHCRPSLQDALGFATESGEFGRAARPNSPIPDVNRSSFRSFGYASLVGLCPTPHKGAALDPPGNQSEMTLAVIGWTPALAFAR